jgi:hypothetical protein
MVHATIVDACEGKPPHIYAFRDLPLIWIFNVKRNINRWCGSKAVCNSGDGTCECYPGYVPFANSVPFNQTARGLLHIFSSPSSFQPSMIQLNDHDGDESHPVSPKCVPSCPYQKDCFASYGHGRCTQPNNCTVCPSVSFFVDHCC